MDVRAILFDVNGTLVDIETDESMEEIYRAIGHLLLYQGIYLKRWEVRDLYFQVMKEQFAASTEKYPEFNVVEVWREILRRQLDRSCLSLAPEKSRQLPLLIAELQRGISRKRLKCFPLANEVLTSLKQRYSLAIVSDGQIAYAVPELKAVGLHEYFDPIIVSGDYGFRKPDARLFLAALNGLHVRPDEAIFVGNDRYRDVFGARQLGMRTVLFASSADSTQSNAAEPDYIIYEFAELPRALDFLAAR